MFWLGYLIKVVAISPEKCFLSTLSGLISFDELEELSVEQVSEIYEQPHHVEGFLLKAGSGVKYR